MSSTICHLSSFPAARPRRLRAAPWVRDMVAETRLSPSDLILPLFVHEAAAPHAISTLPGVSRLSIDGIVAKAKEARDLGIPAIALFPVIDAKLKTEDGSEAFNTDNLTCSTIRALKAQVPEIGVICDVALDPFTSHGQDGVVKDGIILNDATVELLVRQALVLAQAGADVVAPSDMMDGRIGAIRASMEKEGYHDTLILAYAAKYASSFYGPFRDAVDSARFLGAADKRTYQMDPANSDEALREVALDVAEGADMVMVKPALPYLDVLHRVSRSTHLPVLAYQVSGEYAMLHAAARGGMLALEAALMECLLSIRRAGARAVLTYGALQVAEMLAKKSR